MSNKKIIQDILPAQKRTVTRGTSSREHVSHIRDIAIDRTPARARERAGDHTPEKVLAPQRHEPRIHTLEETMPNLSEGRRKPRYLVWISSFVAMGLLAIAFSIILSGASLVVYPKKESAYFNGSIRADYTPEAPLTFEMMTLSESMDKTIPSVKEASVKEFAKGEVTISNTYSPDSQRLIANTRFETPDKKIYRIREALEVPGLTKNAKGEVVAGKITATVYADAPGEEYNIASAKMTIPGFSGSPRFAGFEATTNGPITGGYNGIKRIADEAVVVSAREEMKSELLSKLEKRLYAEKKEGFYVSPNLSIIEVTSGDPINAPVGESVVLEERITAHYFMIPELAFAKMLAKAGLADYENEDVVVDNLFDLEITLATPITEAVPDVKMLMIAVKGTPEFRWLFDAEALKGDLVGKNRQALHTVLSGYPSIDKAEVTLRPFWKQTFPVSPDDISIEEALD